MQFINLKFVKTIKFRLATVFMLILFIFSGSIILLFNVAINNYLSTRETVTRGIEPPPKPQANQNDLRAIYSNNLESIKTKSVISLFPLALICFGLGYYLADRFLKPLKKLNIQIAELKSNNLGSQLNNITGDEIGDVINSFNEMSLRLRRSFDEQSRFVQDASHELRTPLTIVRTNIESALDDEAATKEDFEISMKNVLVEIDSVTELANDLLTLSRPQSKIMNNISFSDSVKEAVSGVKSNADSLGVVLKNEISPEEISVFVNRQDLVRSIKNIIDNAIKYSKEGLSKPEVVIKTYTSNNKAVLEVSDNGPGIPEKDLENIFERFYRVDKSRQREVGGFGLGLPIAKKIILEYGGKIFVVSRPGKTIFTVELNIHRSP